MRVMRVEQFLEGVADRGAYETRNPIILAAAFALGFIERHDGMGMTYDHPLTRKSRAYDRGRYLISAGDPEEG
jgi:hypothetical protein